MNSIQHKGGNYVAALFQLENSKPPDEIVSVVSHLNRWLIANENWALRDDFTTWINRDLLKSKFPNINFLDFSDLDEVVATLLERFEYGQGKLEGEIKILLIAINARFGEVTDKQKELISTAKSEQREAWMKLIFQASSIDDLLLTQTASHG